MGRGLAALACAIAAMASGCGGEEMPAQPNVNVSVGQQLIDLKHARDSGALAIRYEKQRTRLVRGVPAGLAASKIAEWFTSTSTSSRASASLQSSNGKLRPFFASVTRVGDASSTARICAALASGTTERSSAAQPADRGDACEVPA